MIERRPRAPVLRLIARLAMAVSASAVKVSFTPSISNSRWYCLTSAFFGSVRIVTSAASSRSVRGGDHGQTADEFGDQAELRQILGLELLEELAHAAGIRVLDLGAEADARAPCRAAR